jgi:hypothetical protein
MEKAKLALGLALVALITSIGAYYFPQTTTIVREVASELGAVGTRFPNGISIGTTEAQTGKLTVGTSGTAFGPAFTGTCTLIANYSIAATSTGNVDCSVTGVVSGDKVFVSLPASTTIASQYAVKGVSASTTSGFITVSLLNLTGTAAVPATTNGFGSSTQYWIVR